MELGKCIFPHTRKTKPTAVNLSDLSELPRLDEIKFLVRCNWEMRNDTRICGVTEREIACSPRLL